MEPSPGVGTGLKGVFELGQSAASLALSSFSRAISLSSCFIRFCRSIARISYSTTGCQLSLAKKRRHGGKEERYSSLLIDREDAANFKPGIALHGP